MDKLAALRELGAIRRADRWPPYCSIGDFHSGRYESEFVSPYTKSAKNIDASLFVLLQDWASADKLELPFNQAIADLGHLPSLRTNKILFRLLSDVFNLELGRVFATNLFPFIKRGGMSEPIPTGLLIRAASKYAIPQIDIVRPSLVVCLGLATFNAVAAALNQPTAERLTDAMQASFEYGDARVWCQTHPAARGAIGASQLENWRAMKREISWPT